MSVAESSYCLSGRGEAKPISVNLVRNVSVSDTPFASSEAIVNDNSQHQRCGRCPENADKDLFGFPSGAIGVQFKIGFLKHLGLGS